MEEKRHQLALKYTKGIGDVLAKNLIAYCGSASSVFNASKGHLRKIPGIGESALRELDAKASLKKADEILEKCQKLNIDIHHFTDASYPTKLKQAIDAPNIIYSKGSINKWERVLAIVGTRNATEYGKAITEKIVAESQTLDTVIVSGLAYGIDISAHRAAINHQIPNIAVLAGGLDIIYPSAHKKYIEKIIENGGLISENPPGVKAEAHYFPARNRIIAGMSDGVIVVEAAKKGGALITANIADSYNRMVFAVPGDLSNTYSEGCNYLIRNQKALIYTGIADLKYHLNWDEVGQQIKKELDMSNLNEQEVLVVNILKQFPKGLPIDELSWRSQIQMNQLASLLLNLEFSGFVKALPGKKYQLN